MSPTIEGTVFKEFKDSTVGITLAVQVDTTGSQLFIKSIAKDGLFGKTDLVPDLTILNINGIDVRSKSPKEAADILRNADAGEVSVTAEGLLVSVQKKTDRKVGISLRKDDKLESILIHSIADDGLLAGSGLEEGQKIIAINGKSCPSTPAEAAAVIKETMGTLSIVAVDLKETSSSVQDPVAEVGSDINFLNSNQVTLYSTKSAAGVEATVFKQRKESVVGIKLRQLWEGNVVIAEVAKDGLFGESNIRAGQKVVSINGIPCPASVEQAIKLVRDTEGELRIEAVDNLNQAEPVELSEKWKSKKGVAGAKTESPKGGQLETSLVANDDDSSRVVPPETEIVTATATKQRKDCFLGITLKSEKIGDPVFILSISHDGLFGGTDLRAGHRVVAINGHACPSSVEDAIGMLKEAEGELTIVAVGKAKEVDLAEKKCELAQVKAVSAIESPEQITIDDNVQKSSLEQVVSSKNEAPKQQARVLKSLQPDKDEQVEEVSSIEATEPAKVENSEITAASQRTKSVEVNIPTNAPEQANLETNAPLGKKERALTPIEVPSVMESPEHAPADNTESSEIVLPALLETTSASAFKSSKDSSVGITLRRERMGDPIFISSVKADGLFGGSNLRPGQRVVSINGKPCPLSVNEAIRMIKDTEGELIIEASGVPNAKNSEARSHTQARVDAVVDVNAADEKPVRASENPMQVSEAIQDDEEQLVEREEDAAGEATTVTVTVLRSSKDSSVGITLEKGKEDGSVLILKVLEEGLLADSNLRAGQRIVSINGKACPASVEEATNVITATVGQLVIEVEGVPKQSATELEYQSISESVPQSAQIVVEPDEEGAAGKWVGFISSSLRLKPGSTDASEG